MKISFSIMMKISFSTMIKFCFSTIQFIKMDCLEKIISVLYFSYNTTLNLCCTYFITYQLHIQIMLKTFVNHILQIIIFQQLHKNLAHNIFYVYLITLNLIKNVTFFLFYMIKHLHQHLRYSINISIFCDILFIIYVMKHAWPKFCSKICVFNVLVVINISLM